MIIFAYLPVKVAENARVDYRRPRKEAPSHADFEEAVRRAGTSSQADIADTWIETNGSITIIKAKQP